MRPRGRAAPIRCWQLRQVGSDPFAASDLDEPQRPPPHMAKDFLGAAVTLAIIGAILLQVTNRLASQCGAELNSHTGWVPAPACPPLPITLMGS